MLLVTKIVCHIQKTPANTCMYVVIVANVTKIVCHIQETPANTYMYVVIVANVTCN